MKLRQEDVPSTTDTIPHRLLGVAEVKVVGEPDRADSSVTNTLWAFAKGIRLSTSALCKRNTLHILTCKELLHGVEQRIVGCHTIHCSHGTYASVNELQSYKNEGNTPGNLSTPSVDPSGSCVYILIEPPSNAYTHLYDGSHSP